MSNRPLAARSEEAAELLNVLGNAKRLTILQHLLEREMSVNAIAAEVELSQSALSQHLAKLRSLNLVETRRDRQMIYYSCKSDSVGEIITVLNRIFERNP